MNNETNVSQKKHLFNLFLTAAFIFAAMYLCAAFGYRFVRHDADEKTTESPTPEHSYTVIQQKEDPLDLPETDLTSVSLPKSDIQAADDPNDYLVISENGAVKLYFITEGGEQIYSNDLSIPLDSLLDEDKALLEDGIILGSKEELAALLEDYTS